MSNTLATPATEAGARVCPPPGPAGPFPRVLSNNPMSVLSADAAEADGSGVSPGRCPRAKSFGDGSPDGVDPAQPVSAVTVSAATTPNTALPGSLPITKVPPSSAARHAGEPDPRQRSGSMLQVDFMGLTGAGVDQRGERVRRHHVGVLARH